MFGQRHHKKENVEVIVIEETNVIIFEQEHYHKGHKLSAQYFLNDFKILTSMSTISVPFDKNSVAGQLVPTANGNPLPISAIQDGTDSYSSSDEGVCTVSRGGGGAFSVNRVGTNGGSATVNYTAKNTNGADITGSDSFSFDAVPVVVPVADGLIAEYQAPQ